MELVPKQKHPDRRMWWSRFPYFLMVRKDSRETAPERKGWGIGYRPQGHVSLMWHTQKYALRPWEDPKSMKMTVHLKHHKIYKSEENCYLYYTILQSMYMICFSMDVDLAWLHLLIFCSFQHTDPLPDSHIGISFILSYCKYWFFDTGLAINSDTLELTV